MNKDVTKKFPRPFLEALQENIATLLKGKFDGDVDKLHAAVLGALHDRVAFKLCKVKAVYTINLQPAEAIALRLLFTCYVRESTSYFGNRLHQISNQVHQQYS